MSVVRPDLQAKFILQMAEGLKECLEVLDAGNAECYPKIDRRPESRWAHMHRLLNEVRGSLDLVDIERAILAADFYEVSEYRKDDPRGSQYGEFVVSVPDSDNIKVSQHKDGYRMKFQTVGDFINWAKVCT
jgi:hypothetical protein